jgi:hypothetical protein
MAAAARRLLDPLVLSLLASAGFGRSLRFDVRGLVMRDDPTIRALSLQRYESTGLLWLREQIAVSDPLELTRDALQHATPLGWWVVGRLAADDHTGEVVTDFVEAFAASRLRDADLPPE